MCDLILPLALNAPADTAGAPPMSTLDVAIRLGGVAAGLIAASVCVFFVVRRSARKARTGRTLGESALTTLAIVLAPVWIAMIAGVLWLLWQTFVKVAPVFGDVSDDPMAVRWTAFALIGLVTALGALVSAPLALIRVQTTERQTRTAEQGHMTDRIAKAVEQLGAEKTVKDGVQDGIPVERSVPNIEVRIGAILSLERIAQDSTTYDKGRDHVRVMEILCAYIRENAPASTARDFLACESETSPDDTDAETNWEARQRPNEARSAGIHGSWAGDKIIRQWAVSLPLPRNDVHQALNVIGRRTAKQRKVEARWGPKTQIDAKWVFDNLCPRLPEPPNNGRHTKRAIKANRRKLDKWKTAIDAYAGYCVDLEGTNLQNTDLSEIVLSGARLSRAQMQGAMLDGARMEGANLSGARMEGSFLLKARLQGAGLQRAKIASADFRWARLEGADLRETRMDTDTSFKAAHLQHAAVKLVTVPRGVLTTDQIATMFGDGSVILPDDLESHRPDYWPEADLGMVKFLEEWRRWQREGDAYRPPERREKG